MALQQITATIITKKHSETLFLAQSGGIVDQVKSHFHFDTTWKLFFLKLAQIDTHNMIKRLHTISKKLFQNVQHMLHQCKARPFGRNKTNISHVCNIMYLFMYL